MAAQELREIAHWATLECSGQQPSWECTERHERDYRAHTRPRPLNSRAAASITREVSILSILNGDWGPVGPLIKKRWVSWRYRLTQHPFRVEMRVSALAMLMPGHYLKRLKPIYYPHGDVLLANYRA